MSVIAHGIDIVRSERIERIWQRHGQAFLDRIYTPDEISYCTDCKRPVERLAGRWAVKEAVLKALGTGWRGGIEFVDIETLPDGYGQPHCTLRGQAAERARALGITRVLVSISHSDEYAIGSAIGVA